MPTYSGIFRNDADAPVGGRIVRAYRRDTGAMLGEAFSSGGVVIAGDASYPSVELLIGGSPGEDLSSRNRAAYDITESKFYQSTEKSIFRTTSVRCVAAESGNWWYSKSAGDFSLSTPNWTIETWIYAIPGSSVSICSSRFSGAVGWAWTRESLRAQINGAWSDSQILHSTPSENAWHHHALCRSGSVIRSFVDGAEVGSVSGVSSVDDSAAGYIYMGVSTNTGENPLDGYISDFRFTQGVSRYTASFSPPSGALPAFQNDIDPGPLGSYSISTGAYDGEVQILFLDDDAGTTYNDKIMRALPP